jgi:hypothetical protein
MTNPKQLADEIIATAKKKSWSSPTLQKLPMLTDLTLQSGGIIPGGGDGGGGGIF